MNKFLYFIGLFLIFGGVIGHFAYSKYEIIENVKSGKQQCVITSGDKVEIVWKETCE